MNTRINQVRKEAGLTMEDFGKKIGLGRSAVSRIESGDNGPSDSVIKMICKMFHIHEKWLRTGEGEMYVVLSPLEEIMEKLAEIKMDVADDDPHKAEIARFKEKLASAILNLNDESCDLVIEFLDKLGFQKKEEGE